MRLLRYLQEKFSFGKKFGGSYIEVFENPSSSEIKDVIRNSKFKEIRFSAFDNQKKLYIWNADKAIHHEIEQEIEPGGETAWQRETYVLSGNAVMRGNKLIAKRSDQLDYLLRNGYFKELDGILSRNWNWVKRYIAINTLIKEYEREVKQEREKLKAEFE